MEILKTGLKIYVFLVITLLLFAQVSAREQPGSGTLTLVKNSRSKAVLVIPKDALPEEQKAAAEIQTYVAKISGARLEIVMAGQDFAGKIAIRIGRSAASELEALIRQEGNDPCSFALVVDSRQVSLRGLSPAGTLIAAYELLEQLGVRWFMPGEMGTVIPGSRTAKLKRGITIQIPSFPSRYLSGSRRDNWNEHMRMGGLRFPSAHGLQYTREAPFEKYPEYYSLVKGKRVNRQHCISNLEVVKLIVAQTKAYFKKNPDAPWLGMGPNDDGGYCECANCQALDGGDFDTFTNSISMTDRYIWFFNQVLASIKDEFPYKKIAFYAYAEYVRPPVRHKPDPRIVAAMAPITLCRIHGMSNPVCPERAQYRRWIQGWKATLPEVYERGYWYNLSDPGLPFSSVHRMRDEIPAGYDLGLSGWRTEAVDHWGSETPSLYIAAKLMWNHKADVNELLADFYQNFFGPAAAPMASYFTMMDSALRDGNYHTGGSYYTQNLYPDALLHRARAALNQAIKHTTNQVYVQRIAMFRMTFDYLASFIQMQQAAARHNYTAAKTAMDSLLLLQEKLIAYQPRLVNERVARTYLTRFYTRPIESGFERTTGLNHLFKGMDDQWRFILDTNRIGIGAGYWKKDYDHSNWEIITTQRSWGDQDKRYYRGEAWYRQSLILPSVAKDKRIMLWFAGADELAEVWLNGMRLGSSPAKTFVAFEIGPDKPMEEGLAGSGFYPQPFEFDATAAIIPGKENIVSVLVVNQMVNELGTGGIVGPVMFYDTGSVKR